MQRYDERAYMIRRCSQLYEEKMFWRLVAAGMGVANGILSLAIIWGAG